METEFHGIEDLRSSAEKNDLIKQLQANERKLVIQLNKALEWMTWIQLRNHCECEPNSRCVKCIITDDIAVAEKVLKKGGG